MIFELLDNLNLTRGRIVNSRAVMKLSATQLDDLGHAAEEISRAEEMSPEESVFSHSATLSLGGAPEPCANLPCRLRRVDQLIQFAAFYSDRVFIHNLLINHNHSEFESSRSLQDRRYDLLDDLHILTRIRPLIEAGYIVPVAATGEVCNQCVALGAFGTDADRRFLKERKRLAREFAQSMSITLAYEDGEWVINCDAPESLMEHGGAIITCDSPPEGLEGMSRLLKRVQKEGPVPLSKKAKIRLGLHEDAAQRVFGSVVFEMAVAQNLRTQYLSESELPVRILTAISGDPALLQRNAVI